MMQTLATTFGVVFLAELGDKTQLVALGLGARHRFRVVVAGVVAAYLASTLCSVIVGAALGSTFPTRAINLVGGLLFLAFAFHTFWSIRGHDADDDIDATTERGRSGIVTVAVAMFVAEFGDKTMIATGTLAARDAAIPVAVGAMLGITAAGLIGVIVGRALGRSLPERGIRFGSAALFAVFGVVLVLSAL